MTGSGGNIFLVGPMGSGKTTIGRRVAKKLGMEFFDCDAEIEKHTGASVNLIFDIEGEEGFRERESRLLEQLAVKQNAVIATGGGAVLDAANRDLIGNSGLVVWLQTSVDQQLRRLENDRQRPLLQAADRRSKLEALARQRDPLYAEVADLVVKSCKRSSASMAMELSTLLLEHLERADNGDQHAYH